MTETAEVSAMFQQSGDALLKIYIIFFYKVMVQDYKVLEEAYGTEPVIGIGMTVLSALA